MGKRGDFPTGLLYLVHDYCKANKLRVVETDKRVRPKTHQLNRATMFKTAPNFTPYPEQVDAANAAVEHGRGIIVAPTAFGKSAVVALICDSFQVPTLIVVPSLGLKVQLIASLQSWFGPDLVGSLKENRFISVENVDALDPAKPAWNIDLVIIDEFHHSGAKTYRDLNKKAWADVYFKIGLTATPFRSQENERLLLESVLSKVIYRVDYSSAVAKGYITPVEAYYFDLPEQEMKGNEYSWKAVYSELVVNNQFRNQLISELMEGLANAQRPTLCLVKEISHGTALAEHTGCAFANGLEGNNRQLVLEFNLRERNALIGTTGVLGEGVDTKPAEFVILAAGGKSKNAFMQQCGRGFRRYEGKETCKVILFRDKSHKWLLQHFNACVKYLREEYGVKPVRLSLKGGLE
jgi:superfamily II DNA or RNA helicase